MGQIILLRTASTANKIGKGQMNAHAMRKEIERKDLSSARRSRQDGERGGMARAMLAEIRT